MFRFLSRCARRIVAPLGAVLLGLSLMLVAPLPQAQTAVDEAVQARIRTALEVLANGRRIDEIRATPVSGLYEVRVASRLLYIDAQGRYLFLDGDLIDLQARRNLTQERVEELETIDFGTLPLGLAIKQVNGNGERVIAVFEDPNCGYCKRLRADLVKLDDLTIYTYPLAILAADSESKARKALCAPDPARAWNELLLNNRVPDNAGTCDTALKQVHELAQKLGITGTPVVFFSNGRRLTGYTPPESFGKLLSAHSRS